MTDKQQNTASGIIYFIATLIVILGAILRLQHNPHAPLILLSGFVLGTVAGALDTSRLKKKIKRLEEQLNQKK